MKKSIICLTFVLFVSLFASDQIVIFGKFGELKLESYGLKVNCFELKEELSNTQKLRICESIDNSNFAGFAPQLSSASLRRLFEVPEIATALRELLRRNGMLYFGPTNWSVTASIPSEMTEFFRRINGDIAWKGGRYKDVGDGKREVQVEGKLPKELSGSAFSKPFPAVVEKAIRHFGSLEGTGLKPLLVSDKDGLVLATYQQLAKGTVVFSYAFTPHQVAKSQFMENMLTMAYGPLKKLSPRQRLSNRTTSTEKPAFFIDLNKPGKMQLMDSKTGAAPKLATTVTLRCDKKTLFLEFDAQAPKELQAAINNRDGRVWGDDCVEVFLSPGTKTSGTIYQFIVNTKNVIYDSKDSNSAWNMKNLVTSAVKTETGYVIKLEIDMAELGLGDTFRINLCREAKNPEELTSYHPAPGGFTSPKSMALASFGAVETSQKVQGVLAICERPLLERIMEDSEAPENTPDTKQINITAVPGDLESVKLVFYNRSGSHQYYRIEPKEMKLYKTKVEDLDLSGNFKFYNVLPWRACNGTVFDEVVAPLVPAGVLIVPDGANTTLMITVDAKCAPGKYDWYFKLCPMTTDEPSIKIDVKLNVLNLKYPENMSHAYTFGPYYVDSVKRWEIMTRNRIDYLQLGFPRKAIQKGPDGKPVLSDNPADYLTREKDLDKLCRGWFYGYGVWPEFCDNLKRNGGSEDYKDPETQRLFKEYVKRWTAALRGAGYDFSRFYAPLRDEPRSEHLDALLFAGKVLQDNGVQTCNTFAVWTTEDDIKKIAPVVDLWIPFEQRIENYEHADRELAFYHSTGKQIMPYLCSTTGNSASYLDYFRFRGMRSFKYGTDSLALWAGNSWRGNPYHSVEDTQSYGSWLFHHGDGEPVGTLRMEAFREGIEDLAWLQYASKSEKPEVKKLIDKEYLSKLMIKANSQEVYEWRNALLKALE